MQEIWKDIPGYEGKYQASNLGRIKSLNYKNAGEEGVLKLRTTHNGYYSITLNKKCHRVSRLVWTTFNGPIPEGMQVNHINEIRTDNRLENLNLMTPSQNLTWGHRMEKFRKWIIQLNFKDEILHFYPSATEAARVMGIERSCISKCCRGETKYSCGFKWKYAS